MEDREDKLVISSQLVLYICIKALLHEWAITFVITN